MTKRMANYGAKRALQSFDEAKKATGSTVSATMSAISFANGFGFDTSDVSSQVYINNSSTLCFTLHGGKIEYRQGVQ